MSSVSMQTRRWCGPDHATVSVESSEFHVIGPATENNNNNNLICIAPVCAEKTSVALDVLLQQISDHCQMGVYGLDRLCRCTDKRPLKMPTPDKRPPASKFCSIR